ncbi:GH92 family glycosyl hydrolase [Streptococcus catagoni]|uniref:GH92 family glycosyl hydrolase n=1 Tax=Streptococcus catagoni TaxID=2654874 RepID=UPI00140CDBBC|nr:GH92 family glycosyl hydrolase [Streptococcus catagoni]
MDILDFIDTRYGTANSYHFSEGNCLPLTGTPFAMNYLAVQSKIEDTSWWFHPKDHTFAGIRLTHQPSPWIGDFSSFRFLPVSGPIQKGGLAHNYWSYRPDQASFRPHVIELYNPARDMEVKASSSTYCFNFQLSAQKGQLGFIIDNAGLSSWKLSADGKTIEAYVKNHSDCEDKDLKMYVSLQLSQPIVTRKIGHFLDSCSFDEEKEDSFFYFAFKEDLKRVEISGATSFISHEQAQLNLQREGKKDFSKALSENQKAWHHYLDRIEVGDRDFKKVTAFYQHYYRALLFPQKWYEIDSKGQAIHYNTLSKAVTRGRLYTNNGFWDTYKTLYPLLSLIAPEIYREVLEGLLASYKDTGFLPKWLSPDERGMMPGTMADAVIADAALKGIGQDLMPQLLKAMLATANPSTESPKYGRLGHKDYQKLGYIPNTYRESVNQTQDYAYSDFCIGQVALSLGQKDLASHYHKQSLNYRHLIDKEHTVLRGKDAKGQFAKDFLADAWGSDYTEGSSFQNSFAAYHDFLGLITAFGGPQVFHKKLVEISNSKPSFSVGTYGFEIHEMSELAAQDFGQIAISNQPSFHLPYLFYFIGKPEYGQLIIKNLLQHAFSDRSYPGDEDNGSMSSWYLLNSIGLYPLIPGSGQYLLGIPQLDKLTIHLQNQKEIVINCLGNHPQNQFVSSLLVNQEPYHKLYINHQELMQGCHLDFQLGLIPALRKVQKSDYPFSLTD